MIEGVKMSKENTLPIGEYPKFYYSGRKGAGSDINFIVGKLSRMSPKNRVIASKQYEKIYLFHWLNGDYGLAREEANRYLLEAAETSGITESEYEGIKTKSAIECEDKKKIGEWVAERVARLKAAKPMPKTIIGLAEKERAYHER